MDIYGQILLAAPFILLILYGTSIVLIIKRAHALAVAAYVFLSIAAAPVAFPVWPAIIIIVIMVFGWLLVSDYVGYHWLRIVKH